MDRPQDPNEPRVTVVIPCRNEEMTIAAVLDAVDEQDFKPHEIIVVDDQSSDRTAAIVTRWRRAHRRVALRILEGPGRGPAAAMNTGIRAATGDVIVRLDGHCRPQRDYVRLCLRTLVRHDAGVVGGVWEVKPGAPTALSRAIAAVVAHPIGSGGAQYRDAARERGRLDAVDTVPFGCFFKSTWERVGGYDEHLCANEDYDFNHRVRREGQAVLLTTDVRSQYRARPTLGSLSAQYFRYGFWKTQMLRKSPGAVRLRQVLPALLLPWLASTSVLAVTVEGLLTLGATLLYPAVVTAAGIAVARHARDRRLLATAMAVIVVQHTAWSAGFWHGLVWRPR